MVFFQEPLGVDDVLEALLGFEARGGQDAAVKIPEAEALRVERIPNPTTRRTVRRSAWRNGFRPAVLSGRDSGFSLLYQYIVLIIVCAGIKALLAFFRLICYCNLKASFLMEPACFRRWFCD